MRWRTALLGCDAYLEKLGHWCEIHTMFLVLSGHYGLSGCQETSGLHLSKLLPPWISTSLPLYSHGTSQPWTKALSQNGYYASTGTWIPTPRTHIHSQDSSAQLLSYNTGGGAFGLTCTYMPIHVHVHTHANNGASSPCTEASGTRLNKVFPLLNWY